jgi:predicted HAD superfamily Cof-like phosphohydrolase
MYTGMKELINKVADFHEKFGIINNTNPQLIGSTGYQLRYDLALEELQEYKNACQQENLVEIADALGDQLYILIGTILRHGMQDIIENVFNEIHASNMSKLGEDGKPVIREDGKILKGVNYFRPNLKQFFDLEFEIENSSMTKDDIFKKCVMLFTQLGVDSTVDERAKVKQQEKKLLEKLKYIDPAEYNFFMNISKD